MDERVAKEELVGVTSQNLGYGEIVDPGKDLHPLVTEEFRSFSSHLSDGPPRQCLADARAIHHGRCLGAPCQRPGPLVDVGAAPHVETHDHPAQSDGILMAVELSNKLPGALQLPVGAYTAHTDLLAEHLCCELVVALRRSEADTSDLFRHGRPLEAGEPDGSWVGEAGTDPIIPPSGRQSSMESESQSIPKCTGPLGWKS